MQKSLIPLFIVFCNFLNAQHNLSGKITDATGIPFEYCKLIVKKDSVVLSSQFTDSLGFFQFENLMHDSVLISIHTPYNRIDTLIDLNLVTVFEYHVPEENLLDEVEIKVTRPTIIQKVDRVIFTPGNIPVLVGGNAIDVLEFAPGVFIQGNSIMTTSGKTCQVLLNDKLIPLNGAALISFIYSIPTEDIQYVEIMEIVPVKFAANVSGGLIHIKLKVGAKSRISNGSIRNSVRQGMYTSNNVGVNYSYRKNKFSLYSNLSASIWNYGYSTTKEIEYPTDNWGEKTQYKNSFSDYTGGLGLNYECSKNTELGLLFVSNYGKINDRKHTATNSADALNNWVSDNENNSKEIDNNYLNSLSFNLNHTFDTLMKQMSFIVDYSLKDRTNQLDFNNRFRQNLFDSLTDRRNLSSNTAQFISGGLDFVLPFDKFSISTGLRLSHSLNDNELNVFDMLFSTPKLDSNFSNRFTYKENILATYFSLEKRIKKWTFLLAARAEYTSTLGNQITTNVKNTYNYLQVTPQVFVMYRQGDDSRWNFTYNRYFFRANFNELNPFKVYNSAFSYSVGNPNLKPTIYHSMKLGYVYKNISTFLQFNYFKEVATYITVFDSISKIQSSTISNFLTGTSSSLGISYELMSSKRWSVSALLINILSMAKGNESVQIKQFTNYSALIILDVAYALDKKNTFFIQANFMYNTPSFQNYQRRITRPDYTVELKKILFNRRISMSFKVNDLFRIGLDDVSYEVNGIKSMESNYLDTQYASFEFSYSFGNRNITINQKDAGTTGEAKRYKR